MNKTKKSIKHLVNEGLLDGATSAFSSTYTTPLALFLGATEMQIGFLNSIPKLANVIMQPISGRLTDTFGKRKFLCNKGWLLMSILWLAVAIIPFVYGVNKVWSLIFILSLSQGIGALVGIAWASGSQI